MTLRMLRFVKVLLNIAVIDAQSIQPKVCAFIELELLFIIEKRTKSTDGDYGMHKNQLCPLDITINEPWAGKRSGGGIGIVYRKSVKACPIQPHTRTKIF